MEIIKSDTLMEQLGKLKKTIRAKLLKKKMCNNPVEQKKSHKRNRNSSKKSKSLQESTLFSAIYC